MYKFFSGIVMAKTWTQPIKQVLIPQFNLIVDHSLAKFALHLEFQFLLKNLKFLFFTQSQLVFIKSEIYSIFHYIFLCFLLFDLTFYLNKFYRFIALNLVSLICFSSSF